MAEWILLMTLYSKSGAQLETIAVEGFPSKAECVGKAADLAVDLLVSRVHDVRNIKPRCVEVLKQPAHD